jgi:putative phosphoribosyl transferase
MFANREQAGVALAERLKELPLTNPIVLGIPRGGVAIAAAIAREIGAELDVVLARKLGAPYYSEFAIGAIDETGELVLNLEGIGAFDIPDSYIQEEKKRQLQLIAERQSLYRSVRPAAKLKGRSVIITDDGIATGSTMIAALHAVRRQEPHKVILAVPVASPDRLREAKKLADEAICLLAPADFRAVGMYYDDFGPVEDEEVIEYLREAQRNRSRKRRGVGS